MIVSVEIPAFKGGWLERCIESVLYQSSPDWRLSVLWDGGDEESRRVLEELEAMRHPQVDVRYQENQGIARTRHSLTEHSEGDWILPLDDDDALPFNTVERFLAVAEQRPWASILRAKRKFIDEQGKVVHAEPWFAFEPRHYQYGMVQDVSNHSQPFLISRAAYERTSGWEGFPDFRQAGEDCDIYLKLEETGPIELVDEVLYYYRINDDRASLVLTDEAAFEMWRRLADRTVERTGLALRRSNERPPFVYDRLPRPDPSLATLEFVILDSEPEGTGRLATALARNGLLRCGVDAQTIHVIGTDGPACLNAALEKTTQPFVCLLHSSVVLGDEAALQVLLDQFAQSNADLASPRLETEDGFLLFGGGRFGPRGPETLGDGAWSDGRHGQRAPTDWLNERFLLLRREVATAVGGFDEEYATTRGATIDFCLRARQRDFGCFHLGGVGFVHRGPEPSSGQELDLRRLRAKWAAFPDLMQPSPEAQTGQSGQTAEPVASVG